MNKETRNIIDHFHYWKTEAIRGYLDERRNPFSILCCNWQNDFNIGGVIRNSNAFLAQQIWIYGRRSYDKRGSVGTHHYENISFVKEIDSIDEIVKTGTLVAIDNVEGAEPIDDFVWPENPIMAFGQEQIGLEPEILERAAHKVYIRQLGSVRSLNVACASGIIMYDWCRKNA